MDDYDKLERKDVRIAKPRRYFLNPDFDTSIESSSKDRDILTQKLIRERPTPSRSRFNQNFSSRNSLRTSQSIASNKSVTNQGDLPQAMYTPTSYCDDSGKEAKAQSSNGRTIINGINLDGEYQSLSSECFIKREGPNIACLLCNMKEKFRSEKTFSRHLASEEHNQLYNELRFSLTAMTPDSKSLQIRCAKELISTWCDRNYLNPDEVAIRKSIVSDFETVIKLIDSGCACRVIGSLMNKTSLKSSNIDLELIHPNSGIFQDDSRAKNSIHHLLIDPDAEYGQQINLHTRSYDLIPNAVDTLYKIMKHILEGQSDFASRTFVVKSSHNDLISKVPKLILCHTRTNIQLNVLCNLESCYKLSVLLQTYLSLDSRARLLSVIVKYWAKLCHIDDPERGTYPPDAFIILVVYYLQRVDPPVLPCLHEILATKNLQKQDKYCQLFQSLDLNSDLPAVSANESSRSDQNKSPTSIRVQDFIENSADVDNELNGNEADDELHMDINSETVANLNWKSSNKSPVHVLFIDFLKFMIREFDDLFNVITIRTLDRVCLTKKDWTTQVKALENPVRPKINISRCIGTVRTFEFIKKCFRHGFHYLTSLPVDAKLRPKTELHLDPRDFIELYVDTKLLNNYYRRKKNDWTGPNLGLVRELISQNFFVRDAGAIKAMFNRYRRDNKLVTNIDGVIPSKVVRFYNELLLVPRDTPATIFCWFCRKNGHIRNECPGYKVETLLLEPRIYDVDIDVNADFDDHLKHLYKQHMITEEVAERHRQIVAELTQIINKNTGLKCHLQLFGSTVNDLGSYDSDLDICLTLESNLTGKGVDCVHILQEVTKVLGEVEQAASIEPILSARVPIIRFEYRGFDVDLSMYNQCAIYNSKLLKAYASIDERVSQLFYLVKRVAKSCGIADASRGSLSSYAWSLLVIHYLQHTAPPMLPVLQETSDGSERPMIGINGWNVWFDVDLAKRFRTTNQLTLTQLFKGFFLYYGTFDFNFYVVSIRKSQLITRLQKNWHIGSIAIEDPFELTYNLASRLDEPMAIYIINSFAQAFRHFVKIQDILIGRRGQSKFILTHRIFNGRDITNSSPPNRGCKICHRIGHKVKDCPERSKRREAKTGRTPDSSPRKNVTS